MIRALWSAASGMLAQQLNVDTISNNLANVNTPGFKKGRVEFQEMFYETIRAPGSTTALNVTIPSGLEVGHGVRPVATQRLFAPGNVQNTDNPTDLAIQGEGMFSVTLPNGGTGYTRDGSFHLSPEGRLVTSAGYEVQSAEGSAIQVPDGTAKITIDSKGQILAQVPTEKEPQDVGQIGLARFLNPGGLESLGGNLFLESASSGLPTTGLPGEEGFGTLVQGSLELSNVSVVEEMVNLIVAQRAYEVNSKAVQSADEMLGMANNVRR